MGGHDENPANWHWFEGNFETLAYHGEPHRPSWARMRPAPTACTASPVAAKGRTDQSVRIARRISSESAALRPAVVARRPISTVCRFSNASIASCMLFAKTIAKFLRTGRLIPAQKAITRGKKSRGNTRRRPGSGAAARGKIAPAGHPQTIASDHTYISSSLYFPRRVRQTSSRSR